MNPKLYPSFEDMRYDQYLQAQLRENPTDIIPSAPYPTIDAKSNSDAYLNINNKSHILITHNNSPLHISLLTPNSSPTSNLVAFNGHENGNTFEEIKSKDETPGPKIVAPLSGSIPGHENSALTAGLKEIEIFKSESNEKLGLKLLSFQGGIFIAGIKQESPSYYAGVRYSDQILEINRESVTRLSVEKALKLIQNSSHSVEMVLRDRPFVRNMVLHKDSQGYFGFIYKKGRITDVVKGSSACRNGLLIDHHIVDINGFDCIKQKDSYISDLLSSYERIVISIMPSFIYDHFKS